MLVLSVSFIFGMNSVCDPALEYMCIAVFAMNLQCVILHFFATWDQVASLLYYEFIWPLNASLQASWHIFYTLNQLVTPVGLGFKSHSVA